MSLASFSVRRRITVLMLVAGAAVFGWFSLEKLELKLLPDITYPSITVRTEMPGASPEEVESLVSEPIEEMLGVINNLQQITSISTAGMSDVIIAFNWNTRMDRAMMDVREKLDRMVLPDDVEKPRILRYNPETEPIMKLALTGDDLGKIHSIAKNEIAPRIETLEGVAAAQIIGGREDEILVEIDVARAAQLGISIRAITERLAAENVNLPGGVLQESHAQYLIRTINEFRSELDIGEIVIGMSEEADIRLRDVASIRHNPKEQKTITHLAGRESVSIHVFKEGDANIVDVAQRVRSLISAETSHAFARNRSVRELLPDGSDIEIISDQSVFISSAISDVQSNALTGGLLAIVVLFLFLRNLPHTSIVAVSIPVSIVITFTAMYFQGLSLNLMSLGGLALGIGMIVDNSIVVLESIFTRRESDRDPIASARIGSDEVSMAVTASTLTTVAVFFPLVFVTGIAGQIFGDLAATVTYSLIASLLVSLSVIPMLASLGSSQTSTIDPIAGRTPGKSIWLFGLHDLVHTISSDWNARMRFSRPAGTLFVKLIRIPTVFVKFFLFLIGSFLRIVGAIIANAVFLCLFAFTRVTGLLWMLSMRILSPFLALFDRSFDAIRSFYGWLLSMGFRHSGTVLIGITVAGLVLLWTVVPRMGLNLLPNMAQGEFTVEVKMPVGTVLKQTEEAVTKIEAIASTMEGVARVSAVIGSSASETFSEGTQRENLASITVRLSDSHLSRDSENAIIEQLRGRIAQIAGIDKITFRRPSIFTLKTPLEVELRGQNLRDLRMGSERLAARLAQEEYLQDVQTTLEEGYPEIHLTFDRVRLARLNLSPIEVANGVKGMIEGDVATTVTQGDEDLDIRVRSTRETGLSIADIARYSINPGSGSSVTLGSVADITEAVGPSEIRRVDQRRTAIVRADVGMDDLRRAFRDVEQILRDTPPPSGISYVVSGQSDEMESSVNSLAIALALAIFLVYLVMASQFESLGQPLIILFSIPLALGGVLIFLYLLDIPVSIMVFIGMIVLAGIVVNNAILLIDAANQLILSGMAITESLNQAVARRIRPIFMTTLTTVLGLIPMAIDRGPGSEIRMPLAVTIILGLMTSTFLTLVVIPLIFRLTHRDRA